jgi:hypothetical protein
VCSFTNTQWQSQAARNSSENPWYFFGGTGGCKYSTVEMSSSAFEAVAKADTTDKYSYATIDLENTGFSVLDSNTWFIDSHSGFVEGSSDTLTDGYSQKMNIYAEGNPGIVGAGDAGDFSQNIQPKRYIGIHWETEWSCGLGQSGSRCSKLCEDCPVGKYGDEYGLNTCKSCVIGKFILETGTISASSCKICQPGRSSCVA